jgi:hypothetical protein
MKPAVNLNKWSTGGKPRKAAKGQNPVKRQDLHFKDGLCYSLKVADEQWCSPVGVCQGRLIGARGK